MFHDYDHYMVGMHGFWWLFWVLLIILVLFGRWGWGRSEGPQGRNRETPHEILRRRLANGDIQPEEYEQRKALLESDTMPK